MPYTNPKRRMPNTTLQPTIDSFFKSAHQSTPPSAPPLPPTLQSDLLNVGMRIRKAVSEGYKTKDCYFSKLTSTTNATTKLYGTWTTATTTIPNPEKENLSDPQDEGYASLPSSQPSKPSIKRSLLDDPEHEKHHHYHRQQHEQAFSPQDTLELRKASPSPPIPNFNNYSQTTIHRAFALPKSQLTKHQRRAFHATVSRKDGNFVPAPPVVGDFEEAAFLKPVGDVMDVE